MKKQNNLVFFSCVLDDVYMEFKIEENYFNELKEILKREVFYNNKYISMFTEEEVIRSKKREAFLNEVLNGKYLNISELENEQDQTFIQWVRDFLSKVQIERTFSLKVSDIPAYFKAMRKSNLVEKDRNVCEQQLKLYANACQNTEALKNNGISIKENSFVIKQKVQLKSDPTVTYQKKTVPFKIRKIS